MSMILLFLILAASALIVVKPKHLLLSTVIEYGIDYNKHRYEIVKQCRYEYKEHFMDGC
jgi:hypothetical protein